MSDLRIVAMTMSDVDSLDEAERFAFAMRMTADQRRVLEIAKQVQQANGDGELLWRLLERA